MVRTRIPYLLAVCLCLLVACRPPWSNDRVAVAKAGDDILYLDELQSIIPDGIGSGDSLLMAEDYIRKWVTASLLVTKAEENLTMAQRDVTAELKEYRAGLITYRYKKALMAEKLDTVVSDQEITAFYEKNKPHFTLTAPLMKAVFIKIPWRSPNLKRPGPSAEAPTPLNSVNSRNSVSAMPNPTNSIPTVGSTPAWS